MKQIFSLLFILGGSALLAQTDSTTQYKKRVLETAEIDFISSYYSQSGSHAAVTGGIGTEELSDFASDITISIPLNDDDVLTIDASVSAYTSASSSNLDPFDRTGASGNGEDDDDDGGSSGSGTTSGSPWVQSSGASQADTWVSLNTSYTHSSDDRNSIWSANVNFSREYDYSSVGFGGGYSKLFNEKNTEVGLKANVYLDNWSPKYPTELDSYFEAGQNLNNGFFQNIDILDQSGTIINKNGQNRWSLFQSNQLPTTQRNTYSMSLSFSQILSKNA